MSTIIRLFLPSAIAFILLWANTFLANKNAVKEVLKKLVFVEGGTFTMGNSMNFHPTMDDEYLLNASMPQRKEVKSFYISSTEVTNKEWRHFYNSKIEKLGSREAFERFSPDTSRWIEEFGYSYNEQFTRNYHSSAVFEEYPVVGINWGMAQEYCSWLSETICEEFKVAKGSIEFRIPTEAEWEYAASGANSERDNEENIIVSRRCFPWPKNDFRECDSYLANFGPIEDVNGIRVKNYPEDGAFYTSQVGDYKPNNLGLYDMAGNVSEWTWDKGNMYVPTSFDSENWKNGSVMSDSDKIETTVNELRKDTNFESLDPHYQKYYDSLVRDQEVLARGDTRIVKGGSWADGIAYMQIGTKQAIDKGHTSCTIGFRVAATYSDELKKLLPKKKWKASN